MPGIKPAIDYYQEQRGNIHITSRIQVLDMKHTTKSVLYTVAMNSRRTMNIFHNILWESP